jgi:branched-chain amino acid aminotransferase
MRNFVYYVNGQFVPAEQGALTLNDVGVVRGYGVFDVLRTYGVTPFRLRDHLRRLQRSAQQIELALPWSLEEIESIVHKTMQRNDPTDVTIRILVTGGASANFLTPGDQPSLVVMLAPISPANPAHFVDGARLITVDNQRFMPSVKSINYIAAIMAQKKARQAGAVEALYRTADGLLTECTTSNFFVFRNDRLITSDVEILAGITRGVALEIAEDIFEIDYRPVRYDELTSADEAFITSTTKEIMPIVLVDDICIGNGQVGPHTRRLRELFRRVVEIETTAESSTTDFDR